ncbi:MAG: hypothetical protein GW886_06935 [Rhodobacterales bacterium]|nr:hypothetical protein [Rhodobacterales bacterium]
MEQCFFQRYVKHLPTNDEFVFFDRCWYNCTGVARVMGVGQPSEYLDFMRQTPELERMLLRSGIRLCRVCFSVPRDEQKRRLAARETDPLKRGKLSPIDKASLDRWDDDTDTAFAPWTVIKSNDKKPARIACTRHFFGTALHPETRPAARRVGPDIWPDVGPDVARPAPQNAKEPPAAPV